MATIKASETNVVNGLGSWTHTVLSTEMYNASAKSTVNPSSSLSITIAQSGSTSASITSTAPAANQTHVEVAKTFNCVSGDVITFTLSSSAAIDNQLSTIKSILNIHAGTV